MQDDVDGDDRKNVYPILRPWLTYALTAAVAAVAEFAKQTLMSRTTGDVKW